jgi:glucokinase
MRINVSSPKLYIGLDIGKTKISAGIITENGEILLKKQIPTEIEKGGKIILKRCESLIRDIINLNKPFAGIGIASTGVIDPEKGIIISSGSIREWKNIPIRDIFEEEFSLPVKIDNDVNVAALGEYFYGAGKGARILVFMVISTGVGFCIIKDGEIFRGSHNLAGQIAHLPLFQKRLTVNEIFSGKGISERASRIIGKPLSTEEVFRLAFEGNIIANRVIEEAMEGASLTIAWIQNTIDPDIIVIGGGVALNQKDFVDHIQKMAEKILERYNVRPNIKLSQLRDDSALIGCIALFQR